MPDKKKVRKVFCLGDESVNSYGFRLLMSGGDLEQFKANPVMLEMHNDYQVIGKWDEIELKDGALYAVTDFDEDDEHSAELAGRVDRGYIRMASMGIVPLEFSDAPELMLEGQMLPTVTRWKMREASIVPFGSNNNALVMYDTDGNKIDLADKGQVVKLMDSKGFKPAKPIKKATMKNVFKLLELADNASEADVMASVNRLMADKKTAEGKVAELNDRIAAMENEKKEARKQEAANLVDAAVKDGRIDADRKEAYIKLFDADFDSAKAAIEAIPVREPVSGKVTEGKQAAAGELQNLIKLSWDELDKSGKLARIKELSNDQYREKFKEKFGNYPS